MIKNYLLIAWRNMRNNKVYSALNIVGLATGMAVALLIGLWVFNQYSYDRFLPGYQQAYSVRVNYTDPHSGTRTQDAVAIPLADVLRSTIPGIKYVAEADLVDFPAHDFIVGDKKLLINGGTVAADFLKIYRINEGFSGKRLDAVSFSDTFQLCRTNRRLVEKCPFAMGQ